MRRSLALFIAMVLAGAPWARAERAAGGGVEVYPGPGAGAHQSDLYRVEVYDGAAWRDSYTYKVARKSVTSFKGAAGTDPSVNFTTFGTAGEVAVRVSRRGGPITAVEISPKAKGIAATIANGQALFRLKPFDKAWVVIDHDEGNPLFIYADPPKPPVPPGAVYYGPGVHDLGLAAATTNGETLYLDGGAWVLGTLDLRGRSHVTVMGPGVLSGEKWPSESILGIRNQTPYHMIIGDRRASSRDNRLEDITIVEAPGYNLEGGPEYIGNVKLLSPWFYSTDGFQVIPRGADRLALIEHCFAFVGDDIFFPRENYLGSIEIRNCFVSSTNNSVFQICYWGNTLDHHNTMVAHDIDIRNYLPRHNSAVFRASIDNAATTGVKNMTFEHIRIEGDLVCPLIQIENREYFWPKQSQGPETKLGNTSHFIFRDIAATLPANRAKIVKSTLLGLDAKNGHRDYLFENVRINGTVLDQANYRDYITVNDFTSGIRFVGRPPAPSAH